MHWTATCAPLLQSMEYISIHANRRAGGARVRGRVPNAAGRQNGAAKRLGGSHPARAPRLDGPLARRAAGDHDAERRAVLAARGGHAQWGRPGRHVRRPEILHCAGGARPRGERHPARRHQCRHGLYLPPQRHAPHDPPVGPGLSLRLSPDRSGRPRADPDGRVRGRRSDGRAARLLRPPRRLDQRSTAGHYLKAPGRRMPDLPLAGGEVLLLGGTTAILDMETVRHTGAAFRALERIGIRATVGKCLMDVHPEGAPSDLAESTDDALTDAAALAQRWHGSAEGRLRVCFAPRFVPSCSGPLLRAASDLAERFDAQLHTHAAETIVERETVLRATGLEEIAYLDSVGIAGRRAALAHCVWIDSHEMDRLARQGTTVVHCPSSNLKLASGVAKIPELLAAGCRVAIGADGAPCNNGLDAFAEMRLAALIQKPRLGADALPAAQVLELATLGGARALGLEDEIGRIAPGKRADLVVLDLSQPHLHPFLGDPAPLIVYSARASDVRDVFVDGRPVVLGHELLTAPLDHIVREADRAAAELQRLARLA